MNRSIKLNKTAVEPSFAIIHAYTFIATIYCAAFFLVFYAVKKNNFLSVVHLTALIVVITNYFLLQRTKNFKRATNIILATCVMVAISLFVTGGWENTGYLWSFAILPFAFFLSERNINPKWIAALFIGCFIVVVLDFLSVIKIQYSPVVLLNYFAAMLMFTICIFLSQKATTVYKESLTSEQAKEILRREEKFKMLIENSSEAISLLNEDFIPVYCSPSAERITGYTLEEKIKMRSGAGPTHSDDEEKLKSVMKEVVSMPGKKISICFRSKHKAGNYIWQAGTIVNLLHDENVNAIITNFRDITKRKNSEEQHVLYAALVNSSDDAIFSKSMDGAFTSWNKGAETIFGYSSEEVLRQEISESEYPELYKEDQQVMERIKRNEQVEHYETKRSRKDGTQVFLSLTVSPIKDTEGNVIGVSKIARDITRRKHAEDEISKLNDELRLLLHHVQTSREEERKYIAREIHDELGQALTALKIDVSMMKIKVEKDGTENSDYFISELDSMIYKINKSIESVKRIATDLRPEILDHLDIIDALKWQAQQFENITGIQCDVSHLPDHLDLENTFSTTVYRTVQEALTNITRHANASVVRILIEKDSKKLLIEINDNGKGIKEEDIKSMKSLGLIGMRERVVLLNGEMSITGRPDKGTTVAVQIPI